MLGLTQIVFDRLVPNIHFYKSNLKFSQSRICSWQNLCFAIFPWTGTSQIFDFYFKTRVGFKCFAEEALTKCFPPWSNEQMLGKAESGLSTLFARRALFLGRAKRFLSTTFSPAKILDINQRSEQILDLFVVIYVQPRKDSTFRSTFSPIDV